MLTLNDTPLNDNQAIFVIEIEADSTIRICNKIEGITLSGNLYDGEPLIKRSLVDNGKDIDVSNGGGIGNIQAFTLSFARYQTNSLLNDFFNDFFPATSKTYLSSRVVKIGIVWEGATTSGEVTWFFNGYIDEYSYDAKTINLLCLEYAELEKIDLPYYKTQKDFDNQISYSTDLDDEDYGMPIPIVYGSFITTNFEFSDVSLAPAVLMNKNLVTYKACSHKCKTIVYDNWKHDATARSYMFRPLGAKTGWMAVYSSDTTYANTHRGYFLLMMNAAAVVYGYAIIQLNGVGGQSSTVSIGNVTDNISTNYLELDESTQLALRISDSIGSSNIGVLGGGASDIILWWDVASDDGNTRSIDMYHYNNDTALSNSATADSITTRTFSGQAFGNVVTAKSNSNLPFTIEELINYEYVLRNKEVDAGKAIFVYNGYLQLFNILVSGVLKAKPFGFNYTRVRILRGFR